MCNYVRNVKKLTSNSKHSFQVRIGTSLRAPGGIGGESEYHRTYDATRMMDENDNNVKAPQWNQAKITPFGTKGHAVGEMPVNSARRVH